MLSSPFYEFYAARTLESLPVWERFVPVYASSNRKIYPFQSAAASYAMVSWWVLLAYEYVPTAGKRRLYDLLYAYVNQPKRLILSEMDPLRFGPAAVETAEFLRRCHFADYPGDHQMAGGTAKCPNRACSMERSGVGRVGCGTGRQGTGDAPYSRSGFHRDEKAGQGQKSRYIYQERGNPADAVRLLDDKFKTLMYHSGMDYTAIQGFKVDSEVLLSTDNAARGFKRKTVMPSPPPRISCL